MNGDQKTVLGDVEDFKEACATHAWFFQEGWISLQTAVDNLQFLAERWGLVEEFGQDFIQGLIAFEQTIEPAAPSEYETNYIQRIIKQWEAGDAARPLRQSRAPAGAAHIPSSTVDAFNYVMSLGDREHLARWLRDHSDVAPLLLKEVAA